MPEVTTVESLQTPVKVSPAAKAKNTVLTLIDGQKAKLLAAMPKHLNRDRLLRVLTTAVTSNPKLLECYTPSLLGGLMALSQMGLEPGGVLGHAYLIPFSNKKKNRIDVQVIIGYKGLIDLARRSGNVVSIAAHEVYSNDLFEFEYGLTEKLRHIPASGERGEITHFYAYAKMVDGGHAFEVMSASDVRKIRQGTQGRSNEVWDSHFGEMGRKTLIRRLSKYLPLSIEAQIAISIDELDAAGKSQQLDTALDGEWSPVEDDRTTPVPVETTAKTVPVETTAKTPEEIAARTLRNELNVGAGAVTGRLSHELD